jgi:hypothetical protein
MVFVSCYINQIMMKRYFPYLLLLLGMAILIGLSSCNSQKRAAAAEAKMLEQKREQGDRDKARFEQALPATATE